MYLFEDAASAFRLVQAKISPLSKVEARRQLDKSISVAEAYLQALRDARNEYAEINALPAEILSAILVHCVQPERPFEPVSWTDHVKYTTVCRAWRNTALKCAAYWSCIPTVRCHNLPEMLRRSGGAPFSLRVYWPANKGFDSPPLSKAELNIESMPTQLDPGRIMELHVMSRCRYNPIQGYLSEYSLDSLPPVPMPLLQSIHLTDIMAPAHLLTLPRPALRYLKLHDCMIPWDDKEDYYFPSLIELTLWSPNPNPSTRSLCRLLSSTKCLEYLSLLSALEDVQWAWASEITGRATGNVVLTHLQILRLSDPLPACSDFYRHISHSKSTSVNVDTMHSWEEGSGPEFQGFMHCLLQSYQRNCGPDATSSLTIAFAEEANPEIPLSLAFGDNFTIEAPLLTSDDFLDYYTVPGLTRLTIDDTPLGDADTSILDLTKELQWMEFLARHRGVEEVKFIQAFTEDINRLLQDLRGAPPDLDASLPVLSGLIEDATQWHRPADPSATDIEGAAFLLPSLKHLSIEKINFNEDDLEVFKEIVEARNSHGCPLLSLHLVDVDGVTEEALKTLKGFVAEGSVFERVSETRW